MMKKNKVYCIIVTYNAMKWIERCLNTIQEDHVQLEIIVIDNNSTDETVAFIKKNFPSIQIFPQQENLGFSGANNLGYELAKKNNADFVYLLNQDTISYPNNIEKLIKIYDSNRSIGVVSPLHLNDDGNKLDKKFEEYITSGSCPHYISDISLGKTKEFYQIGFVNAAAWLIKVETIQSLGGLFSKAFYHYGEDSNFLSRLRFHKKICVIVPNVFIHHLREEREGKMSTAFENRKLSIKKVEIMTNPNISYKKAMSNTFRYAGQQLFRMNIKGACELFSYPLFHYHKINKFRASYKSGSIL